jgi:hypothetical protein
VLLVAFSLYQRELHVFLHVRTTFQLLALTVHLGTICTMLSPILITVILPRRFLDTTLLRDLRDRTRLAPSKVNEVLSGTNGTNGKRRS